MMLDKLLTSYLQAPQTSENHSKFVQDCSQELAQVTEKFNKLSHEHLD